MSAGICGKRLGLEEIFGSPSSATPAKKIRFCGSPIPSVDLGFGSADDDVSILIRMFPSMDREVITPFFFIIIFRVICNLIPQSFALFNFST